MMERISVPWLICMLACLCILAGCITSLWAQEDSDEESAEQEGASDPGQDLLVGGPISAFSDQDALTVYEEALASHIESQGADSTSSVFLYESPIHKGLTVRTTLQADGTFRHKVMPAAGVKWTEGSIVRSFSEEGLVTSTIDQIRREMQARWSLEGDVIFTQVPEWTEEQLAAEMERLRSGGYATTTDIYADRIDKGLFNVNIFAQQYLGFGLTLDLNFLFQMSKKDAKLLRALAATSTAGGLRDQLIISALDLILAQTSEENPDIVAILEATGESIQGEPVDVSFDFKVQIALKERAAEKAGGGEPAVARSMPEIWRIYGLTLLGHLRESPELMLAEADWELNWLHREIQRAAASSFLPGPGSIIGEE